MIVNILTSDLSPRDKFILIVAFAAAAMVAIMGHECAHGFAALKCGDDTAKREGRLTFNPVAHFSLAGMLAFFLVGFGWAKPVPVDPDRFTDRKKGVFLTSVAGVAANLCMALVSLALLSLLALVPEASLAKSRFAEVIYLLAFQFVYYGILLNMSLMLFNLMPVYPLDGFRVIEALAKPENRYVEFMYRYGAPVLIIVLLGISFIPGRYNVFTLFLGGVDKLIDLILRSVAA